LKINELEKIDISDFEVLAKKRIEFYQNKNRVETLLKLIKK